MNITTNTLIQGMNTLAKVFLERKRMKKRIELAQSILTTELETIWRIVFISQLQSQYDQRDRHLFEIQAIKLLNSIHFGSMVKFQTFHILSKSKENKKKLDHCARDGPAAVRIHVPYHQLLVSRSPLLRGQDGGRT